MAVRPTVTVTTLGAPERPLLSLAGGQGSNVHPSSFQSPVEARVFAGSSGSGHWLRNELCPPHGSFVHSFTFFSALGKEPRSALSLSYTLSSFFKFYFETMSCQVAWEGLKLAILPSPHTGIADMCSSSTSIYSKPSSGLETMKRTGATRLHVTPSEKSTAGLERR